ncbi:Radical SAM domain protein [Desulfobulbus propionicus DSM 2032]|jgi:7-carboxy-7-deazaguanine synthase|uniref:7-carboxy-7-deazaguanine synthase n=1 Tax=Desulfobulbus propionicus (strain ATCC 33891 / DSM 2032 / VKM B-1956 / 1pr3) TaxID=577650 RepID=A0A7U3YLF1_DESPD|nr:radical SAM protein [Desulfobulbus propionicus]ADW17525.1 Radical SAM domain protein [Desulfobulbus propionicus DSM 2032]
MVTEPLLVCERFYSIQGESTRAGLPCLFVRLAGCNLRCSYCDARYTWEETGETMTVDEILAWAEQYPGVMVEVTGGEPLRQNGVYPLMRNLLAAGLTVLLETNGSLPLCGVPEEVGIVMDIKCPDSGMAAHNLADNLDLLRERARRQCRDEIKFVLSSVDDFHWARQVVTRERLDRLLPVLFSPVRPLLDPALLAQLLLDHRLNVRLQLQLHALLWPDRARGV